MHAYDVIRNMALDGIYEKSRVKNKKNKNTNLKRNTQAYFYSQ